MNIPKTEHQYIYPLGTSDTNYIKDSSKHIKPKNTSTKIKNIRDFQSSCAIFPSSPRTQREDEGDVLRYNTKSKNIEYKHEAKKPFQVQDINIVQNIGEPIRRAGMQSKDRGSSRANSSRRFYDSQIVLGDDQNYMPMSTTRSTFIKKV